MATLIENPVWSPLTKAVVGACFEVHKQLGPGLLESVYDDALAIELAERGMMYERQYPVPVVYKGRIAGDPFRIDFFVSRCVILEIKAVEKIHPIHIAQTLTYLKLTKAPIGFLVNFHEPLLKDGIRRLLLDV